MSQRRTLLTIGLQITLLVAVLVGVTVWVLVSRLRVAAGEAFVSRELIDLDDETRQIAYELLDEIDTLEDNLVVTASHLQRVIDPQDGIETLPEVLRNLDNRHLHVELRPPADGATPLSPRILEDVNALGRAIPLNERQAEQIDAEFSSLAESGDVPNGRPALEAGDRPLPIVGILILRLGDPLELTDEARSAREDELKKEDGTIWTPIDFVAVGQARFRDAKGREWTLRIVNSFDRQIHAIGGSSRSLGYVSGMSSADTTGLILPALDVGDEPVPTRNELFAEIRRRRGRIESGELPETASDLDHPIYFRVSDPLELSVDQEVASRLVADLERDVVKAEWRADDASIGTVRRVGGFERRALDHQTFIRLMSGTRTGLDDLQAKLEERFEQSFGEPLDATWHDTRAERFRMQPVRIQFDSRDTKSPVGSQAPVGFVRQVGSLTGLEVGRGIFDEELKVTLGHQLRPVTYWGWWWGVAAVALALGLAYYLVRPLHRMTTAAEVISGAEIGAAARETDLKERVERAQALLPTGRRDEFGVLATAFDRMLDEVLRGHDELDERVRVRTEELQAAMARLDRAREAAVKVSKQKDEFLGNVSHELRTPLHAILGFQQLLELTDLDDGQRADLQKIRVAALTLRSRVNDILDYQKIVVDGMTLEPSHVEIAPLMRTVGEELDVAAREAKSELRVRADDDAGAMSVDGERLKQVLQNLVGNALKFKGDDRENVVTLSVHAEECEGKPWVRFEIADTGRGMNETEQRRLFKRFRKLSNHAGNTTGTGLGLVICRGLCELMGGTVTFESEFGRGTTFRVLLPRETRGRGHAVDGEDADEGSGRSRSPEEPSRRIHDTTADLDPDDWPPVPPDGTVSGRVLVIDDDPNQREFMERYLAPHGYEVLTAVNGTEGLELARTRRPDLITLDAIMPGLDGFAVLAALKNDEQLSDIPVVMITIAENRARGYSLGADDYLVKPIDAARLSSVVARHCKGHSREILVVDDDADIREILRRNLESNGYTVREAGDGRAALEILDVDRLPAAVLLDLVMPVMDGFEFLAAFREDPRYRDVPVIVVTARDWRADERERILGSVDRIVRKGEVGIEEILDVLRERVDGGPRRRASADVN